MEINIDDLADLRGTRVTIYVSDPWEFGTANGVGPFGGTIQQADSDRLAIALDRELSFLGDTFAGLVVAFRTHSGAADIRSGDGASANFTPVSDASRSTAFTDAERWRRWGLIGSVAIADED
jgi:hypothetical protein